MPDETSIPHIKEVNENLKGIHRVLAHTQEEMRGQLEQVQSVARLLHQSIVSQTSTLGELEIIGRIGELQALEDLVAREQKHVLEEDEADAAQLARIDEHFAESRREIGALRNRRVGELLAPVYRLLDEDLQKHVENRLDDAFPLLKDFGAVTTEVVREREAALQGAIQHIRAAVDSYRSQRRAVHQAVASWLGEPDEHCGGADGVVFGLPVYVVEIEGPGDAGSAILVPPSTVQADAGHPFGFDLVRLAELDGLWGALSRDVDRLAQLARSTGVETTVRLGELLPAETGLSGLARRAFEALRSALDGGRVTLTTVPRPGCSLESLRVQHQAAPAGGGQP
jgi:hypothetical protein